ncbi:MAG: hypothetical protein K2N90_07545 [Lachnospiraceae bacterium]|nr:hypothetical protein [Lachnospiraceae bacterium]
MNSTTNESDYSLFSIRQAARTCSLSRSGLMRLEERGLLTPAYTDANNGYHYHPQVSRLFCSRQMSCHV